MISKSLSDKIKIAGLLCTLMVLYRHSLNYLAFFNSWTGMGISKIVEDSMSKFTEIAVPYFFIVSGFFFLRNSYYERGSYVVMIKKKAKTLFLPFLIWNIAGAAFLWFIAPDKVGNGVFSCLYNLLQSNWYGPLWYVRDLMIMMILIPLYNWLFLYNRIWLYIIALLISGYMWIPVSSSLLSSESVFFFLIGGVIGRYPQTLSVILPVRYVCLLSIVWFSLSTGIIPIANVYVHKMNTLIGIVVFWMVINYMKKNAKRNLLVYAEYSFLFYVVHAYPMKAVKQGVGHLFSGNDMAALITYIMLPLLTAAVIYQVGKLWKKYFPKSYKIALGGR